MAILDPYGHSAIQVGRSFSFGRAAKLADSVRGIKVFMPFWSLPLPTLNRVTNLELIRPEKQCYHLHTSSLAGESLYRERLFRVTK